MGSHQLASVVRRTDCTLSKHRVGQARASGALPSTPGRNPAAAKIGRPTSRRSQRGSTALEFALVVLAAVPMLFGGVGLGIILGRGIQAVQVTRDAGHMYGLGVDFSAAGAQNIVAKLAQGFNVTSTGNAVLIFSQIVTVYQADCDAAGLTNSCSNLGQTVFAQRIVMGNSSLRTSAFGTPPAGFVGANGNIAPTNYYQQSTLRATGFGTILAQNDGDTAWVVEGFFTQPDLSFLVPGFQQVTQGTYVRSIF